MQRYKSYAEKKEAQRAGTYEGNSPFWKNIPEFQYLKPLHKNLYPHLRAYGPLFKLPLAPRPWEERKEEDNDY